MSASLYLICVGKMYVFTATLSCHCLNLVRHQGNANHWWDTGQADVSKRTKVVIEAKLEHSQTSGIRPSVLVCLFFLCCLKFVKIFISRIPKQKDFCVKTGMCLFFFFLCLLRIKLIISCFLRICYTPVPRVLRVWNRVYPKNIESKFFVLFPYTIKKHLS